jgi:predicted nucleic acid-binding protein
VIFRFVTLEERGFFRDFAKASSWRQLVLSNHLLLEYEEVLKRNAVTLGLTLAEVDLYLNAICQAANCIALPTPQPPRLPDPDDEPLLRLAEASDARLIATHNLRHVRAANAYGLRRHSLITTRVYVHIKRIIMTTLQAAIPDDLHSAVLAQAEREHISVDALVSRTLRAAVAVPLLGLSVEERAARGNWEDFDRIMTRVPDASPVAGDER